MTWASLDHRRGPDDPLATVSQHLERAVAARRGAACSRMVTWRASARRTLDGRRPEPGQRASRPGAAVGRAFRAPRRTRPPRRRDGKRTVEEPGEQLPPRCAAAPRTGRRRFGVGPGRPVRPTSRSPPCSRLSTTTASATGRRQSETSGRVEGYQITRGRSDRVKGSMIESRCSTTGGPDRQGDLLEAHRVRSTSAP